MFVVVVVVVGIGGLGLITGGTATAADELEDDEAICLAA